MMTETIRSWRRAWSSMPALPRALALMLALGLGTPHPVAAQERTYGEPREGDTVEWYTVEPGDTMASITKRFLGTDRLWPENYRLNPHLRDPNLLTIGDRLLIITKREPEERSAEIVDLSPRVDKRLVTRGSWEEARLADRLGRGDGLQTLRSASAELAFDDGTTLVVSQDSVVFLRQIDRRPSGVSQETIEIEEGGADLMAAPRLAGSSEIEVIVGNATARPRTGRSGQLRSRVQRDGGGPGARQAAELAVYEGSSSVAAAGETVEVETGMGTTVPDDGPPSPPERLLPAPRPISPGSKDKFGYSNPTFNWSPIEGADRYQLEICRDSECGSLVAQIENLASPPWRPDSLPGGNLYWRVRALSPSGLDGYPSRGLRFAVEGGPDLTAPVIALVVERPGRAQGGIVYLAPNGRVRPVPQDDQSGVDEVRYRWNEDGWRRWRRGDLEPPPERGVSTLELIARDRAGRESAPLVVEVHRLAEVPAPPLVRAGRR